MKQVAIVGAGFTGLAAGLRLARCGYGVTILEAEPEAGGLAGSFPLPGGQRLERFYHHWFIHDRYVLELARMLGRERELQPRESRTGLYFEGRFFNLASPLDVLRFSPLSLPDRLRLGMMALLARRVRNWRPLENVTAREWLQQVCGERVYRVVWEPLLVGKFGEHAESISAVWFWNKLKLRGGSRGKHGREMLAYYSGGFAALVEDVVEAIRTAGGKVLCNAPVTGLQVRSGAVRGVDTTTGTVAAGHVLLTTPLPIAARLLEPHVAAEYTASLQRIGYLSNVCVVLSLKRSLSPFYWLNVNDLSFPFVAVIEHTNFEPSASYDGQHIVYLSKYLPGSAPLCRMSDGEVVRFSLAALERMFPHLRPDWVLDARVWRADHAQPIVERHYSSLIPSAATPVQGVHLASMAQIYPEDRGTNYAVREGFRAATRIMQAADCGARQDSWEVLEMAADGARLAPVMARSQQISS